MHYKRIDMGAYNLHIIKTTKFKTITVEVNFREKANPNNIALRNILKSILLNSNKKYPTERELIKETENLYDLKLISSNIRIGNYSNLSFKIRFLNEKYTEKNMNKYSIEFLLDIIFSPDIIDNSFKEESLSKCKLKLEKDINSLKDNKLRYTLFKLLETTKNKPYSYSTYGTIEELNKINTHNLYEYYKKVIKENYIDIFVVGDIDIQNIKPIFKEKFKITNFKKQKNDILVEELKKLTKPQKISEEDNANQSQLTILCSLNNLTDYERKYVLAVYNEMLGGSSNSLLFDTVREKNSYAYYINSIAKAYDNTLIIYSGIEADKEQEVVKLIKKTLHNISKGYFDEKLLNSSKETIISSIKASKDSPAGIINSYYAKELINSLLFEERIDRINEISKKDIINISKKISLHTEYLLIGKNIEGDNNEKH
ncbi:MAG: pitrilysin family protein [Bacilli bacterium]|nr:pitrilysin family protein [Bacilli bacterium]